ncbi:uncharacterized protein KQ657_004904 [Scheffersomyces spartinae]|uniref:Protein kinase domain-containing protein n=1 Tax=Scheffersomyces spartinae TaxID=45513 RepID=A0A9P7VA70_9ASCO|nr:uncharacterized protein KQ657_004904 [Scheffersomyces spartinae]KAG7194194.1 hypothetical protein KQ657_004904 [Scheffersomyces spartinae]
MGSPLDVGKLEQYLKAPTHNSQTVLGLTPIEFVSPITVKQFRFGQSNPTYYLKDANGREAVLRRKPIQNSKLVSKSAHAVEREFYLLRGIGIANQKNARKVPIPQTYLLCEDELVIGYVFYVMEFINGKAIKVPEMPGIPEEQQLKYWDSIMETLAAIHSLDAVELIKTLPATHFPQFQLDKVEKLSSSTYFERQVRTMLAVSKKQSQTVDPIPHFDFICQWILNRAPQDPNNLTLVHGDFKIDNLLFDDEKVVTVLDWELCTFGHPIFDLSNFLQSYDLPKDLNAMFYNDPDVQVGKELKQSTEKLARELRLYQSKYGRSTWKDNDPKNNPLDLWPVGFVFGLLRLCVISQGIAMRSKGGTASSAQAQAFGLMYPFLADLTKKHIEEVEAGSKL